MNTGGVLTEEMPAGASDQTEQETDASEEKVAVETADADVESAVETEADLDVVPATETLADSDAAPIAETAEDADDEDDDETADYSFELVDINVAGTERTKKVSPGDVVKLSLPGDVVLDEETSVSWSKNWFVPEQIYYNSEPCTSVDKRTLTVTVGDMTTSYYCYIPELNKQYELKLQVGGEELDAVQINYPSPVKASYKASATLKVPFVGEVPASLSYRWRKYGTASDNSYYDELIPGAASDTYTVPTVTEQTNYICEIYDSRMNVRSVYFTVSVDTGLTVTDGGSTYCAVKIKSGETKVLSPTVTVQGATVKSYQWYANWWDENNNAVDMSQYISPSSDGKKCTVSCPDRNITVFLTVTDSYGTTASFSYSIQPDSGMKLIVPGEEDVEEYDTSLVVNKKIVPGTVKTLSVSYSEDTPQVTINAATVQWLYREGDEDEAKEIAGATSLTYTAEVGLSAGTYICTVTDQYDIKYWVRFEITADDGFSWNVPSSLNCAKDKSFTFTVPAPTFEKSGLPADYENVFYEWDTDEYEDKHTDGVVSVSGNSVTFSTVTNEFEVKCTVKNSFGLEKYKWITVCPVSSSLAIANTEAYSWWYDDDDNECRQYTVTAKKGENADLNLKVITSSDVSFTWTNITEDEELVTKTASPDENGYAMSSVSVTADTSKYYECVVTDATGNMVKVRFAVKIDSGFKVEPYGDDEDDPYVYYAEPGEQLKIEPPKATVDEGFTITYNWTNDDTDETVSDVDENGCFTLVATRNAYYSCRISDNVGNYKYAYVEVVINNDFTVSPVGNTDKLLINAAEGVTMTVDAKVKRGGITYSWSWYNWETDEGDSLDSKTNTCKAVNPGRYTVSVKDDYGNSEKIRFWVYEVVMSDQLQNNKGVVKFTKEAYQYIGFEIIPSQTGKYQVKTDAYVQIMDDAGEWVEKVWQLDVSGYVWELTKDKHYFVYFDYDEDEIALNTDVPFEITGAPVSVVALKKPEETKPETTKPETTKPETTKPTPAPTVAPSPTPVANKKAVKAQDGSMVTTTAKGEASISAVKKTNTKSLTVKATTKVNGVSYKVTSVAANAFRNATKAKTVVLPNTIKEIKANAFNKSNIQTVKLTVLKGKTLKVNKKAFKGSKVKKVQVTMKKATKSQQKKVINALKKAGIKPKNITIKTK